MRFRRSRATLRCMDSTEHVIDSPYRSSVGSELHPYRIAKNALFKQSMTSDIVNVNTDDLDQKRSTCLHC